MENKSARVSAEIDATSSAKVQFNQYYFPGWGIKIDGRNTDFKYSDTESNGLPVFDIEKGNHKVLAEFKNTADRNLAEAISVISVIVWLILLCRLSILH